MFPFCFLCEKHVDISRTYPSSMFLIISLFDNSDMAIFKSRIVIIDQYLNNPSHTLKDINAVFLNTNFFPSNSGDYRNSLRSEYPSKLLPASFSCAVIAKSLIFALSGLLIWNVKDSVLIKRMVPNKSYKMWNFSLFMVELWPQAA